MTEAAYCLNLFENANSPGDFWKVTNRILKKNKVKKCGPIQDKTGNIMTGSGQKADYFNDFFLNIALDLTRDLSPLPPDTTNLIYKVCPTMSSFSVEWNIVQEIVQKSLNPNKAMGLDNISSRDLRLCESSVVQGLFEICMKSRADCQFPNSWKKSRVAAVFKKGNRLDVNNYRPISLLSVPSKILERVVCRSFDNHLTSHSLWSDRQWGFRKGHSTESLLLHLTEVWKEALDNGLKVGVLFIDFRKAFDCVDHVILGEKLKALGVSEDMWIWLMDYLANRTQLTQIDGIFSQSKPVKIGVPQGSLLGPRLFITYVNDLPDSIRSGEVYMYADDTTIYTIGNTIDEVAIALQEILDELQTWCQKNRLIIHEGKCDAVLLDTKPFTGPLKPLVWGDKIIEYRSFSLCLGIAIDERLSWAKHVKSVSSSYSSKVKMLRRISFLPKAILETIYYKTVIPSVLYAIVVWGSCSDYLMKDLELIHLRAARLIHKLPRDMDDETVLINANWMPLKYFYCSRILNITHRAFYDIELDDINRLVAKNASFSYSLRKSLNISVSRPRTEQGRRSFKHRAAIAWNSLPDNIKQIENPFCFKRKIKSIKTFVRDISFQKECSVNYNKDPDFNYF